MNYRKIKSCGKWDVMIPTWRMEHMNFEIWEQKNLEGIERYYRGGDFFDIGTEHGEVSAIIAKIVGAHRMHLFEPSPSAWPNIKATWEANGLAMPAGCWVGFVSNKDNKMGTSPLLKQWPACATAAPPIEHPEFKYLSDKDHVAANPQIMVDDYCNLTSAHPGAIMLDVEGAELQVLYGAHKTLELGRPVVFTSIHREMMVSRCGDVWYTLFEYMHTLRYQETLLSCDHEEHWVWNPL